MIAKLEMKKPGTLPWWGSVANHKTREIWEERFFKTLPEPCRVQDWNSMYVF